LRTFLGLINSARRRVHFATFVGFFGQLRRVGVIISRLRRRVHFVTFVGQLRRVEVIISRLGVWAIS
jgi:hypothetical protein